LATLANFKLSSKPTFFAELLLGVHEGADLFNIFVKYATFGRAERSEEMTSNQVKICDVYIYNFSALRSCTHILGISKDFQVINPTCFLPLISSFQSYAKIASSLTTRQ